MSNVISDIQQAPHTFTNWDACMSKAYCKWPAIVGIVIASLVVLSILWCVASCLCCGATLCASCVKCLTCCGCCGACRSGGGSGDRKRHQDDYARMPPAPYNGYQAPPANMSYAQPAPQPDYHNTPQFATFETSKSAKINEDSLPSMPTWASATSRRVEDHSEPARGHGDDVEMGRMATSPLPHSRPTQGPYSRVPNGGPTSPLSPQPQGYFDSQPHAQAQPYQSDIGAQRMVHHENDRYGDNFQNVPMSPAPTYTSDLPPHMIGAAATTDRFSPTYDNYNNNHTNHYHAQSPGHDGYSNNRYHAQSSDHYASPMRSAMPMPEDYNGGRAQQTSPQYSGVVARTQSPYSAQQQPTSNSRYVASNSSYNDYQHSSHNQQQNHHQRQDSYGASPTREQSYSYDHTSQVQQGGVRPPSLLQVGRKALAGSQREV